MPKPNAMFREVQESWCVRGVGVFGTTEGFANAELDVLRRLTLDADVEVFQRLSMECAPEARNKSVFSFKATL